MKIDISTIDRNSFYVNEHIWNGELVYLVNPKELGVEWNHNNKIFRSSVWNSDGELISASFPKFVNWGEKPEIFPAPTSLDGATIVEKLDGSTLIVSKYKGNYMIRTRGSIDASKMELNGHEIEIFKNDVLPKLTKSIGSQVDTWNYSVLFEWTSPLNKIVLDYGDKPQFFLIGLVYHRNYELMIQDGLDSLARFYDVNRPAIYTFGDIKDLLANIEKWTGKEGVCVYHSGGQEIHKVKSSWYLFRHYLKSKLNTVDKVMDFWFDEGKPNLNDFQVKVEAIDYELWNQVCENSKMVIAYYDAVLIELDKVKEFVNPLKTLPRKDAAMKILAGHPYYKSICFALLDNKVIDDKTMKKLMLDKLNYPLLP